MLSSISYAQSDSSTLQSKATQLTQSKDKALQSGKTNSVKTDSDEEVALMRVALMRVALMKVALEALTPLT